MARPPGDNLIVMTATPSTGSLAGQAGRALDGKWVWVWNWRRCDGGDPAAVAPRLRAAGCRGALVKAHDGPRWFDQGLPWREIARALKAQGMSVGGWGYFYGQDLAGEAQRAIETVQYGEADLFVLDVEAEFKRRPEAADELCRRIREAVGGEYPLYYSSFAIARYHLAFPFAALQRHCAGAAPQVYWNAFRWPLDQALAWMYDDYATLGVPPEQLFPVAGVYHAGSVPYPSPESVRTFAAAAAQRGSPGVSFWSYEHMNAAMWQAVAEAELAAPSPPEEDEMSSREAEELRGSLAALGSRVDRLEAEFGALRPAPSPAARTYTVQPGDTLSQIAARLGVADWRRLYETNRGVIGADPNLIRPGQVLIIP